MTSTGGELPLFGLSARGAMSGDGRYVLFETQYNGVVPGDTNGFPDVFLHDRQIGTVRRISLAAGGVQSGGTSHLQAISGDGRTALITCNAPLDPADFNGKYDLYAIDIPTGAVTWVTVNSQGVPDGFLNQHLIGSLSRNGRMVAFATPAGDLVPGDSNGFADVFVRDLATGTTTRVSVDPVGGQADGPSGMIDIDPGNTVPHPYYLDAPQLSADGRFVIFTSQASNLVAGDTNGAPGGGDVFVRDLVSGVTERVSVATGGVESVQQLCSDGVVSADGRYAAFYCGPPPGSMPTPLPSGIYLRDRMSGTTTYVRQTDVGGLSLGINNLWMTPDGQTLAFPATTSPFGGSMQSWVFNQSTGVTRLVSETLQGQPGGPFSEPNGITDDGSSVLFFTSSPDMVPNDTNNGPDLFVRACSSDWGVPFCPGTAGTCPCAAGAGIAGCDNSHATGGAKLRASGPASVTSDSLSLIVTDTTAATSALFFQGTSQLGGGTGVPFGSGLRCVGGAVRRLGTRVSTNGTCWYGRLGGDTPISIQGQVPGGGSVRHYQVLYRDPASTCAGGAFNLSNGVSIVWAP